MTFESAVNSLTDGMAAKRATWRGYANRVDTAPTVGTTVKDYGPWQSGTAYVVDDKVSNDGSFYICKTSHEAGDSFDASNWETVTVGSYTITFNENKDTDNDGTSAYSFVFTPYIDGTSRAYKCTEAPTEKPLYIDSLLMTALLATDWTVGTTSVYKEIRDSAEARW